MTYVDGFAMAVPTANRAQFQKHGNSVNGWFLDNGAIRVVDAWGEDIPKGEVTDFHRAVAAKQDETVCISWVEWPDKATRDAAMERMEGGEDNDERLDPQKHPMPMDGKRMIFGGFETLYDRSA